jgi:hypothetical protein
MLQRYRYISLFSRGETYILKMEATKFSETLVSICQIVLCHISEDPQSQHLKFHLKLFFLVKNIHRNTRNLWVSIVMPVVQGKAVEV